MRTRRTAPGWLAVLALLASAPAAAQPGVQPGARRVAPGVTAATGVDAAGMRTVEGLRISPERKPGEPPPDLGPLLTAAYDWCAGNVDNGFEKGWSGFDARHGCDIEVDAGVYRIRETAILRQTQGQRAPIAIDLGGAVILHMPEPAKSVRVAELASQPCTPAAQGRYLNVEDAASFDDIEHADPRGRVEIARIGPNSGRTKGCPEGGTVCKFGAQAVRVETRGEHGLADGGELGIGDVVEIAARGSEYDGVRLLVKEVVSKSIFLSTVEKPPRENVTSGSLRRTATTAWCNGARWRPGKPMIAIGGPGSATKTQTTLRGGIFAFDMTLFRSTAVLVDGERDASGRGGAEWVRIEGISHTGSTALRGQTLVALGTPHVEQSFCLGIEVDASSDFLPPAWSPAVWNQTCDTTRVHIRQHHGGGVWWGLDSPGYMGPASGSLIGYVEGCRDGPCLWVRSGKLVLADGFKAFGSVWGPQGQSPGPNAGKVAILGTRRGVGVNVVAHGATWGAGQDSDLDCYVTLGNVSHLVQVGGYLLAGNRNVGSGEERLFCAARGATTQDVYIEHAEESSWGGAPRIYER